MHIDLFKCTVSESICQRRHDAWPLYRFYIKYNLDLFIKWRHFRGQIQIMILVLTLFHSIFQSCTVLVSVRLSICELEICSSICQKNTLQNDFVLEFRKSPTFNLKQLQAEDIFSYSLSIAGKLFHIPANTHSLILIRLLLVEIW